MAPVDASMQLPGGVITLVPGLEETSCAGTADTAVAGAGLAAAAGVARVAVAGSSSATLSELEAHVHQGWFEDGRRTKRS